MAASLVLDLVNSGQRGKGKKISVLLFLSRTVRMIRFVFKQTGKSKRSRAKRPSIAALCPLSPPRYLESRSYYLRSIQTVLQLADAIPASSLAYVEPTLLAVIRLARRCTVSPLQPLLFLGLEIWDVVWQCCCKLLTLALRL